MSSPLLHGPLEKALADKRREGRPGGARARLLEQGRGWCVRDVLCTSGPKDPRFEEQHGATSVSLVLAGSFTYRSARGAVLLSPGALLLGNAGHAFECSHEHGEGDHCLSFQFEPALLEELARGLGVSQPRFATPRLPPLRSLAPLVARAPEVARSGVGLEALALQLAERALAPGGRAPAAVSGADLRRVGAVLQGLQAQLDQRHGLDTLAAWAGMSRWHFLRTFQRVTGVTPHQWLLRARLREAAHRLSTTRVPATQLALDVGFPDLSHFTRSFRSEFGLPPGRFRSAHAARGV